MSAGWLPLLAALGMALAPRAGGDVDLAKSSRVDGGRDWAGRRVGEVLDPDGVARIVLLKAVTSTTGEHDLANIRRILRAAAGQPFLDEAPPHTLLQLGQGGSIWEAVILTRDGAVFGFSADPGRACLRADDGRAGCFALPRPAQD